MTRTQPAGRRRPVQATGGSSSISALIAASRGRAVARLAHALAFRVAIVAAPACYDRGAVADECLRAGGVVHRRVSPAPGDSGIVGLLRSLAFAVSDAAPTLTSAYVGGPAKFADAPDGAEQLARWAAGELRDVRTTLVVEGVDVSDPRLAAFLAALVDRTHAGLRWLIVAETHALLPVARWMAEGTSAAPLDESDLAIAPIDLLRASRSLAVRRPEPLERLCRVAGGWPAAIALGVAAGPGLDIAGAPVERAALFDWLADAALAQLSPRERALLDATCLFDRIDPALLDALGWNDAVPLLDGLCDGLGLVRADADGGCRYDERLAAYLQRRLRARADGSFERITADAAHAYERAGRIEAAIGLRVAQRDGNAIGVLLAEHGFRLIDRGGSMLVARALECVGEDVLLALPSALAVKACLESLHGKFDVAEAWFRVALERADDASERLRIAHRLAVDLVRRERPDAIELLRQLTASLAAGDGVRRTASLRRFGAGDRARVGSARKRRRSRPARENHLSSRLRAFRRTRHSGGQRIRSARARGRARARVSRCRGARAQRLVCDRRRPR
jgi:ATP/maltotriose-dependent transcriptional regulator MalT